MDIASQNSDELAAIIAKVSPVIEKEPADSINCLVSTKNGKFNPEMSKMLKNFTEHNKPYMKLTALIGIEGLQRIIYDSILLFTGRKNMIVKNSREEAMDWLAGTGK
jgi:hypothetical protein